MKKLKQAKGITLIALIITIIILLILAVVTIKILVNEGIIVKAQQGVNNYSEEEIKEKIQLAYTNYQMEKLNNEGYTFEQALQNSGIEYKSVAGSDEEGYVVTVQTRNGERQYNVSARGVREKEKTLEDYGLKIGDYVDYDPIEGANAEDLKYTSPKEKTGYNYDQEFTAEKYKNVGRGWRVLDISNGKIRLIAEMSVRGETSLDYNLVGQKGFINGIDELNKISAIFGHGKGAEGATSITVEDINSITGYNPTVEKYDRGSFGEYGNKVTYTRGEGESLSSSGTNGKTWSGDQGTFNYYDKERKDFVPLIQGNSTDITSTDYRYIPEGLFTRVDPGGNYWVASYSTELYASSVIWGLFVKDQRYLYGKGLTTSAVANYGHCEYLYVVPVITLKSNVSIDKNGKDGSSVEQAYEIK